MSAVLAILCALLQPAAVQAPSACRLADSLGGSWCSERFELREEAYDLNVDVTAARTSPCGRLQLGVDLRFVGKAEPLRHLLLSEGRPVTAGLLARLAPESLPGDDPWRALVMLDSSMVVVYGGAYRTAVELGAAAEYLTMSPGGRRALVRSDLGTEPSGAAVLSLDPVSADVSSLFVGGRRRMFARHFGCAVSDAGLVLSGTGDGAVEVHVPEGENSWDTRYLHGADARFERLRVTSAGGVTVLAGRRRWGLAEVLVLGPEGHDLARFEPLRESPRPALTPDGEHLVLLSGMGASIFGTFSGRLEREHLIGQAVGPPVVSPGSARWAGTFEGGDWVRTAPGRRIVVGDLSGEGAWQEVFADGSRHWAYPRVLAVSDNGDVLIRLVLKVPGMPRGIRRLLLVGSGGEPLWMSEPLWPAAGGARPTRNISGLGDAGLPSLADLSSDGRRVVFFDYSGIREVTLLSKRPGGANR
ncbi:MAG: hypothetical protein R6U36_08080 [Candidatus Fermentibacteraceae bacterium]